jgi:hypothetical protein
MTLSTVALKESERREIDFDKGIDRYKSLLKKLAKDKKMDVLYSVEGAKAPDLDMTSKIWKCLR